MYTVCHLDLTLKNFKFSVNDTYSEHSTRTFLTESQQILNFVQCDDKSSIQNYCSLMYKLCVWNISSVQNLLLSFQRIHSCYYCIKTIYVEYEMHIFAQDSTRLLLWFKFKRSVFYFLGRVHFYKFLEWIVNIDYCLAYKFIKLKGMVLYLYARCM